MENTPFTTWLEIDLSALNNNIRRFKQITSRAVMAVVKANAYGHGAVKIAEAASLAGADWLGVARFEEALVLREAGNKLPILVMGFTQPVNVAKAIEQNISLALLDRQSGEAYLEQARQVGKKLKVQVKVDTGMGRLGVFPDEAFNFVQWINEQEWIECEGVFTHFARADEPGVNATREQIIQFSTLITQLETAKIRPNWVHACNSAGVFNHPEAYFDMVRPGISMYGLNPSKETPAPPGFRPVMEWKTRLVSVKNFPAGHGISYSHIYTTTEPELIGAIPVGYADNYRRQNGNIALVHGRRVNVVGRVCMDQTMIQLKSVPDAKVGDEVVLIGRQGEELITADEIAAIWNTVNYEVIANLSGRLPKIYING